MKSIVGVLEEFEVLIDTHFDGFSKTKSSLFLKGVTKNQNVIETSLLKKTQRTLNPTPKTMKVFVGIQENLLSISERGGEFVSQKKTDEKCWCSKAWLVMNEKQS